MLTPVVPSTSNINDRLQCRRHLKAEDLMIVGALSQPTAIGIDQSPKHRLSGFDGAAPHRNGRHSLNARASAS